jgi:hypothetical protein
MSCGTLVDSSQQTKAARAEVWLCVYDRLARGLCRQRAAEAVDYAIATQDDHGVEQGRGYGLTYDGNAGGVD